LKKRSPVMKPSSSERNFTPSSTAWLSSVAAVPGCSFSKIEHGQTAGEAAPTTTGTPSEGVSRLPLSSTARLRMVAGPASCGVHV
jgi:hypothetical protein